MFAKNTNSQMKNIFKSMKTKHLGWDSILVRSDISDISDF